MPEVCSRVLICRRPSPSSCSRTRGTPKSISRLGNWRTFGMDVPNHDLMPQVRLKAWLGRSTIWYELRTTAVGRDICPLSPARNQSLTNSSQRRFFSSFALLENPAQRLETTPCFSTHSVFVVFWIGAPLWRLLDGKLHRSALFHFFGSCARRKTREPKPLVELFFDFLQRCSKPLYPMTSERYPKRNKVRYSRPWRYPGC